MSWHARLRCRLGRHEWFVVNYVISEVDREEPAFTVYRCKRCATIRDE